MKRDLHGNKKNAMAGHGFLYRWKPCRFSVLGRPLIITALSFHLFLTLFHSQAYSQDSSQRSSELSSQKSSEARAQELPDWHGFCEKYLPESCSPKQGSPTGALKETLKEFEIIQKKSDLENLAKQSRMHRERIQHRQQQLDAYLSPNSNLESDPWPSLLEAFDNLKALQHIDRPLNGPEQAFYEQNLKLFPVLADKNVQKMARLPSPSSQKKREALLSAIHREREQLRERETQYLKFEKQISSIQKNSISLHLLNIRFDELLRENPLIIEDLKLAPQYSPDEGSWCRIQHQAEKVKASKAQMDQVTDIGLGVAALFIGPYGRAANLLAVQSSKLLSRAFMQSSLIGLELARQGSQLSDERKSLETCQSYLSDWLTKETPAPSQNYQRCVDEFESSVLINRLSTLGMIAPALKVDQLKKLRGLSIASHSRPQTNAGVVKVFPLKDGSTDQIIDLRVSNDPHWIEHANQYWDHAAAVYSKKLKLSPEEIKNFRRTNDEVAHRTILISRTKKALDSGSSSTRNNNFSAGVGIVYSTSAKELLPLEKATGQRLNRKEGGKIAEFIRLTSEGGEKEGLDLIRKAADVTIQDQSINTVYVYTSKVHKRLYQKWGIPYESSKDLNSRDVLLILNRDNLKKIAVSH